MADKKVKKQLNSYKDYVFSCSSLPRQVATTMERRSAARSLFWIYPNIWRSKYASNSLAVARRPAF